MSVVLPGLGLSAPQPSIPQAPVSRIQRLEAGSEYRFEVAFGANVQVKLLNGTAEVFGTELAHNVAYTFSGTKAAVYTWHGCRLDVLGPCESEYSAEETPLTSYANVHFALEDLRTAAESGSSGSGVGPRVLVVGPADAGKTSLARILTAYATKADRQPVVVNLDPRQGLLGVPGSLTAAAFATPPDVGEEGWGCSPVSGPTPAPVKTPLVYHYGLAGPEEAPKLFKPLVTRLALAVTSRLDEDPIVKASGCIIDTPGSISQGKGGSYEIIQHIVSEFSGMSVGFVGWSLPDTGVADLWVGDSECPRCAWLGASVQRHVAAILQPVFEPGGCCVGGQAGQVWRLRRPGRGVHEAATTCSSARLLFRIRRGLSESIHPDG